MVKQAKRYAWTRIEVLVIVLTAATGAGLVATLLLQSRTPAQRVECTMHLQQVGAALQAYHDERKSLPASCLAPGYATWAVQVAPFLPRDLGGPLKAWDLGLPYYAQTDAARQGQVWVYYCPARRAPGMLSEVGDVPPGEGKFTNLAGALGDYGCAPTSDPSARPWTSPLADGALIVAEVLEKQGERIVRWQSRTTLAALARGQQNTILLGEKHVPLGAFGQVAVGDGSIYNGDHQASFARLVGKDHPVATGPEAPYAINFGSWHPGLCQFLMADGGVRAIASDVSPALLQDLVPRTMQD